MTPGYGISNAKRSSVYQSSLKVSALTHSFPQVGFLETSVIRSELTHLPASVLIAYIFSCVFRPKIACQALQPLPTPQNPITTPLSYTLPFGKFLPPTAYH
jgi:hypothetical protein